jgi:hypothetical protein
MRMSELHRHPACCAHHAEDYTVVVNIKIFVEDKCAQDRALLAAGLFTG